MHLSAQEGAEQVCGCESTNHRVCARTARQGLHCFPTGTTASLRGPSLRGILQAEALGLKLNRGEPPHLAGLRTVQPAPRARGSRRAEGTSPEHSRAECQAKRTTCCGSFPRTAIRREAGTATPSHRGGGLGSDTSQAAKPEHDPGAAGAPRALLGKCPSLVIDLG